MTDILSPSPRLQFFDNNGRPAVGYKVFTYEAGTTTKLDTYTDSGGLTPNSNPIVLDYRGEAAIWIPPNVSYKYVFANPNDTDPPTAPIWTVDNLVSSQLITLYGGVDTGSAVSYILNFDANFSSLTDGIIIYFIPAHTNTGASNISVNGSGGTPIVYPSGGSLDAGSLVANQMSTIMYFGGNWLLLSQVGFSSFFTGTLTGMAATTTGDVSYVISGSYCTLIVQIGITGTSNSTAMTLTGLPAEVRPNKAYSVPCSKLIDNGVTMNGTASINGGTITFTPWVVASTRITDGVFTTPGTKGLSDGWSMTYPLR